MSEPLIQTVDQEDNPIGAMTLVDIHAGAHFHRVARIFLKNSVGDILLQKRSQMIAYPGLLDSSAAGHVDEGESYIEAAYREMFEELGIEGIELKEIGYHYAEYSYKTFLIRRFNRVYTGKINFTPPSFNREEIESLEWIKLSTLKNMVKEKPQNFVPDVIESVKRYY